MLTIPLQECWHFFDHYGTVYVNWYPFNHDAAKDITWYAKDNFQCLIWLMILSVWNYRESVFERIHRLGSPNYRNPFKAVTWFLILYYIGDWVLYLLINRKSGFIYSGLYFTLLVWFIGI